ncbi:MAG: HIT domain-containing protein [Chloroflexi bacterium]|nr:HIT domain-containing protein [Chloroflexota bacterium]
MSNDCKVCRTHRGLEVVPGGVIVEDELVVASHAQLREGQDRAYLGYLMVETRRHIPGLADLTEAEGSAVMHAASRLARALMATEHAYHVYSFVIGHGVPHFHMHVVAKYPGAPREYWGPRVDEWPDAPHGGPDEIAALCARLRGYLAAAP